MLLIIGMVLGFYLSLYILPLIPGAIDFLSNKPNRYRPQPKEREAQENLRARDYKPSRFGFFTYLHPGQVKVIELGGRFVSCIMAYDRHMFKGERTDNDLTPKHADYWGVIATEFPYHESHPIPFPKPKSEEWVHLILWWIYSPLSVPWWIWKRWVYRVTGAVFTGIPPFQVLRVYPMERFNRVTRGSGGGGKVELVRMDDFSDHYRVAHFQYPALIAKADTQDKIPVDVLLNIIAAVFNAYMVAYNTDDDWPTRFLGAVSNWVTMFTRPRPLDEVWTAKSADTATELANFITGGGPRTGAAVSEDSTRIFGVRIIETQVLDISPSNPADEQQLGGEARAIVQRRADQQLAVGRAAYIQEEGKALQDHPNADIVVQTEAMVRAAEAAGKNGGIVILGGQSFDPGQAAILQELRKKNK